MLAPFFVLGMTSTGRQIAFRRTVAVHVLFLAALLWALELTAQSNTLVLMGYALVAAGIVEGAVLIGWRLTQLPKSQSLEFLLSSPVQPKRIFIAEALVGISRLALVQFAGTPVLLLMLFTGGIEPIDLVPMVLAPFIWGAITGIGLTVWAYETIGIRKIGERFAIFCILLYLIVGVVAGENLRTWLRALPPWLGEFLYRAFQDLHVYNPFGVMQYWMESQRQPQVAIERMLALLCGSTLFLAIFFSRAMCRFKGHFDDRHYRPIDSGRADQSQRIGLRPLSWWAVRRVMEYSGRVNIWLAGGFGLLYSAYLIAGEHWPVWMGRLVFQIFERMGGAPALVTGLVILSAVPAAFQYGLWDSSAQDRCRRLELLLLTKLDAGDYWHAALAAAWRRGRGYAFIAAVVWFAMVISGQAGVLQVMGSIASAVILWGFSFALGFMAFNSGMQANGLGSLLTLGLPLIAFAALRIGFSAFAALMPPGAVYVSLTSPPDWSRLLGPMFAGGLTLYFVRNALLNCDRHLRAWYDHNHGAKLVD
jgi:hypothetical protein